MTAIEAGSTSAVMNYVAFLRHEKISISVKPLFVAFAFIVFTS